VISPTEIAIPWQLSIAIAAMLVTNFAGHLGVNVNLYSIKVAQCRISLVTFATIPGRGQRFAGHQSARYCQAKVAPTNKSFRQVWTMFFGWIYQNYRFFVNHGQFYDQMRLCRQVQDYGFGDVRGRP
jgi:hypothetical protein